MGALTLDQNIISFFMVFIAVVVGIQAYLQLRIKNVLQALTMNADSVVHNIRKIAGESKKNSTPDQAVSNTCQFCKHRLAFINIDKNNNPEEEFYHRCGLRDMTVALDSTCPSFEKDEESF